MQRLLRFTSLVAVVVLAAGCSIKQDVRPAQMDLAAEPEICLVPATGVRESLSEAYEQALQQKGFTTKRLSPGTRPSQCALSTAYTANWSWDLALYMSYAKFEVFQHGRPIGQATYDSTWGGARLDKFISAESKVFELVEQLFPMGASQLQALKAPSVTEQASLSKEEQLRSLQQEKLTYEEYQRRYRLIMAP